MYFNSMNNDKCQVASFKNFHWVAEMFLIIFWVFFLCSWSCSLVKHFIQYIKVQTFLASASTWNFIKNILAYHLQILCVFQWSFTEFKSFCKIVEKQYQRHSVSIIFAKLTVSVDSIYFKNSSHHPAQNLQK